MSTAQNASIRPRRSVLYMPGSNQRALDKARTLAADALILDLEDAVAPDAKIAARALVREAVAGRAFGPREVAVRINATASPWGEDDLAAIAVARPDAILIPKVETPATILAAAHSLDALDPDRTIRLWAMMETPLAMLEAKSIAGAARTPGGERLAVLVMGTNDLAKETRARLVQGRAPMLAALSLCVLAARAYSLDIVDGVYNTLGDIEGLRRECEEGRDLGMDGKTLIHPEQIATANQAYAPDTEEVARARRIIAAFAAPEAAGKGVLTVDGRMVERLHADMAERLVALHKAIIARSA